MACKTTEVRTVPVYNNSKPQIVCVEPADTVYIKCTADTIFECIAENSIRAKKNLSEWKKYRDCINSSVE